MMNRIKRFLIVARWKLSYYLSVYLFRTYARLGLKSFRVTSIQKFREARFTGRKEYLEDGMQETFYMTKLMRFEEAQKIAARITGKITFFPIPSIISVSCVITNKTKR